MPAPQGSAAVSTTPQSADKILSPDEVLRLDLAEYVDEWTSTLAAMQRVLLLAAEREQPSPEIVLAAQQLATSAGRLRSVTEWLLTTPA